MAYLINEGSEILLPPPTGVAATDTAMWTSALAALPTRGGKIKASGGVYVLNSTLIINKPVIIEGVGNSFETWGASGPSNLASTVLQFQTDINGIDFSNQSMAYGAIRDLYIKGISASPNAPSQTAVTGSALTVGNYVYMYTFVISGTETAPGNFVLVPIASGNQAVQITVASGPAGTTARNIYRTKVIPPAVDGIYAVPTAPTWYKLTTIANNNNNVTYTDTTPDASLTTAATYTAAPVTYGLRLATHGLQVNNVGIENFYDGLLVFGDASHNGNNMQISNVRSINNRRSGFAQLDTGANSGESTIITLDCTNNGMWGIYCTNGCNNTFINMSMTNNIIGAVYDNAVSPMFVNPYVETGAPGIPQLGALVYFDSNASYVTWLANQFGGDPAIGVVSGAVYNTWNITRTGQSQVVRVGDYIAGLNNPGGGVATWTLRSGFSSPGLLELSGGPNSAGNTVASPKMVFDVDSPVTRFKVWAPIATTGVTGATAASRYAGATASGAPSTGTFSTGDFVVDQTGKIWVCTTAGAPGTWASVAGAGGGSITSVTGTAPIVSSGGNTPAISITAASGSSAGSMAAADYTTLHQFSTTASQTYTLPATTGTIAGVVESVNTNATAGATPTLPDVTVNTIHYLTLTANITTLTFPTAAAGKSFVLVIKQGSAYTIAWPGTVKWPGGTAPTLTTTSGKFDSFSFVCVDGTNWLGYITGQNF